MLHVSWFSVGDLLDNGKGKGSSIGVSIHWVGVRYRRFRYVGRRSLPGFGETFLNDRQSRLKAAAAKIGRPTRGLTAPAGRGSVWRLSLPRTLVFNRLLVDLNEREEL